MIYPQSKNKGEPQFVYIYFWGPVPSKDMQTLTPPAPLLRSGHIYIIDVECAESNEK